jgi:hypothetical protein
MIRVASWCRVPSTPVLAALPKMKWSAADGGRPAAETAALMLFVALNFSAMGWAGDQGEYHAVAEVTYDDLGAATGLSRALISAGLQRLVVLGLIQSEGSSQKRRYVLNWQSDARFFKLPCRAVIAEGVIKPFTHFTLRSKHELHAMKLYLYLAAVRSNEEHYSMASYKKISDRTGIAERDIRKAVGTLLNVGLLVGIGREHSHTRSRNEPNKYYLYGHAVLVKQSSATRGDSPAHPEREDVVDLTSEI